MGPHQRRTPEVHWAPVGDWLDQSGDCWAELLATLAVDHPQREACERRRTIGIARYGVPLRRDCGLQLEDELRDELLDAAVYAWAVGRTGLALALLDVDDGPIEQAIDLRQQLGDLEERLVSAELDLALERTAHGEARADLSLVDRALDAVGAPQGPRAFRLGWLAGVRLTPPRGR